MRRFIQAILATVTLALTMGFVPSVSALEFEDAALFNTGQTQYGTVVSAVAVDADGYVYTGTNWAGSGDLGVGDTIDPVTGFPQRSTLNSLAVHKVSPTGEQEWVWKLRRGQAGGAAGKDSFGWITDIQVDQLGNTYVTAYWHKFGTTSDGVQVFAEGRSDGVIFSIDPDGKTRWAKEFHASSHSYLLAVDVDNNGSVVVAGRWSGSGRMMHNGPWDNSDPLKRVATGPGGKPFIAKLDAATGETEWSYWWNVCVNDWSILGDVTFLSDGSVVAVGGYNDKGETTNKKSVIYDSRSRSDCPTSSIKGSPASSGSQKSHLYGATGGARSNMVKLSADGDFLWGREWGSPTQYNHARELAVDPTNDDLFIVGSWSQYTEANDHFYAPSIPSNAGDFPDGTFERPGGIRMDPDLHEGCLGGPCNTTDYLETNQDTYLLHTDKHGNYKNHTSFDVSKVVQQAGDIAISSDGSELALTNTGFYRHPDHAKPAGMRHGAAGWVMTVNTADLTEKWTVIHDVYSYDWNIKFHKDSRSMTWAEDVRYGPDDRIYVSGRAAGQVNFGKTVAGPASTSPYAKYTSFAQGNWTDSYVIQYDSDGNVAGGVPPVVPDEFPDGYSLIKGPLTYDDFGDDYYVDYGGEVVWNTPLCKGGRWEIDPQPGIAIRQYVVNKADFAASSMTPGEFIRTNHSAGDLMLPNYNILWQDGYQLDTTGFSADPISASHFKVVGWDDGVDDINSSADRPVGFYFRHGVFTYNTNHSAGDSAADPSVYEPVGEVSGHSWDLDTHDVFLAFAHPSGTTDPQFYPEFEQKGCEPGEFVACASSHPGGFHLAPDTQTFGSDCDDTYGFEVSKDDVTTTEEGGSETFTVVLTGPTYFGFDGPTADVVMDVVNTDSTEVELSTDTLVFTPDNWNVPQTITVTGLDDGEADGDITSYVNIDIDHDASSYEYAAVPNQFVTVVNENDDLLPPPPNPDLDGDGILNINEVDGCVEKPDCDGDGINDGNEIFACMLAADCDGDGVGDNEEISQACIQDPSCTDQSDNVEVDPTPPIVNPPPVEPPNPDPDPPPPIIKPDPPEDPQDPTDLLPDEPDPQPDADSDDDGVPDTDEIPGCEDLPDCDGDGLLDGEDGDSTNPDADGDGLPDGFDPDPTNPDSDGDGIPDGDDSDADGNGIPDEQEQGLPGSGLPPAPPDNTPDGGDSDDEPSTPSDTDDTDDQAPLPVQTPDAKSSGRGLADRLGDLPLAAVAAAAALAIAAAAAAAASLAGPSLLSWLFRGSLGVWLFGLLFGRRGVRCSSCDLKLVKQEKLWVDKDTQWVVGINNHTHVPADFSDKDRDKYVTAVQQILQRSDP